MRVANTKVHPFHGQLQAAAMQAYDGPALEDTIHDHRARGAVVSHPHQKAEKQEIERER